MIGQDAPEEVLDRAADYLSTADGECSMGFDASGVLPADLTLYRVARAVSGPLADLLRACAADLRTTTSHLAGRSPEQAMRYADRLLPDEMAVARAILAELDGGDPR